MAHRTLLTAGLLLGGLALAPAAAQAGWSEYKSAISEVDACNQAQYLMPEKAVVQEFRYAVNSGKSGNSFTCKVRWSDKAGAEPSNLPVLLPAKIRQPIFAGGWL
ncbi:MAG: hypothetical protein EBW30_01685 [Synechococcaceae bacterium WB7_3xG_012]|nr:hypothetical protein [Synechococcaceae bacterium WB7_3xG_012]